MGHDVTYLGKLTPKTKLNDKEKKLLQDLQDDDNYDRLYALIYNGDNFQVSNDEKIYVNEFFEVVERYISKLKEGGNDIEDGGYLVSCSEYGINDEAIILLYKDGEFRKKPVLDLVDEWTKGQLNK